MTLKVSSPPRTWQQWVSLAARILLAGVFLWAGLQKVTNLEANVLSVQAYRLLPAGLDRIVAYGLPVVEIIVGLLLLTGLFTQVSSVLALLMLATFIAGIASAWARGLRLDCGCFSQGGALNQGEPTKYLEDILRDLGFAIAAAWLIWRPRTRWSLDRWVFASLPVADSEDLDPDH